MYLGNTMLALKGKHGLSSVSNTKVLTTSKISIHSIGTVLLWQIIYTKTHNLIMLCVLSIKRWACNSCIHKKTYKEKKKQGFVISVWSWPFPIVSVQVKSKQAKRPLPNKQTNKKHNGSQAVQKHAQTVVDKFGFPVHSTDPDVPSDQTLIFQLWAFHKFSLFYLKIQTILCQILCLSIK